MYIGPLYFDAKEMFLIIAAILVGLAMYFGWPLWVLNPQTLLVLMILVLFTKGILQSTHNDTFFFHALVTLFLTIFLSTFQVVLFYVITFVILKALKAI